MRVRPIPMIVACMAGGFSILFIEIAFQGNLGVTLRPLNLIARIPDTAFLIPGFLAAFFLFRPLVHPCRWPPYAFAAGSGAAIVMCFRITLPIVVRIPFRFPIKVVPYRVVSLILVITTISFLICLVLLFLYRITIDRTRLCESSSSEPPQELR